MERKYCKKCSKCRERSVVLSPVSYSAQVHNDGREYTVVIPSLVVPQCSKCGYFSIDHEADCAISAAIYQQVGLLTPEEIRSQRESIGLTQQQLSELMLVEPSTLSRWEAGDQYQPRSLDRALRVFFKNPALWRELEPAPALSQSLSIPV